MNAQAAGIQGGSRAAPQGRGEVERPRGLGNPARRHGPGSRGAAVASQHSSCSEQVLSLLGLKFFGSCINGKAYRGECS